MSDPTDTDTLRRRRDELLLELEQLEDVTEDEDVLPEERLFSIRSELKEIDRQLDPETAEHRRHDGRSDADSL